MAKGLVITPCKLLLIDNQNCSLSVRPSFLVSDSKKVHAVISDIVVFAINIFSCRLLTELSLDEACLKTISPQDAAQTEKAKNNIFLKRTIERLRPVCEVDEQIITTPLFMWNK